MKLTVMISTIGDRIRNCEKLLCEPRRWIDYVIVYQPGGYMMQELPEALKRHDVTVVLQEAQGLTISRNVALEIAKGDVAIFADDDVSYCIESLELVRHKFIVDPCLDVGLFKIDTLDGEPEYKAYPPEEMVLDALLWSISSVEMGVNVSRLKIKKVCFDERFGAGTNFVLGGEESIFIEDCIGSGLTVKYFPEYIVKHPFNSTIKLLPKSDLRRAFTVGAVDARRNGWVSVVKAGVSWIKNWKALRCNGFNPITHAFIRLLGSIYILSSSANRRRVRVRTVWPV